MGGGKEKEVEEKRGTTAVWLMNLWFHKICK